MLRLKIDLHVHTHYSPDSIITPRELVSYAKKRGLDGVAITDHDRIDGALRIAREADFLIIPGVEVSSLDGHILGLCVSEEIPRGMSADDTVDKIHKAGGIAVACHPVTLFKGSLRRHTNPRFEAIEVMNSSSLPFNYSVKQGKKIALSLGIAQTAGSDAHYGPEIGYAYTVVEAESRDEEITKAIRKGFCRPFGRAIPMMTRLKREVLVFKRKFQI